MKEDFELQRGQLDSPDTTCQNYAMLNDPCRDVRGQMTILFAVMAVALFAFLALTIDGGLALRARSKTKQPGVFFGAGRVARRWHWGVSA